MRYLGLGCRGKRLPWSLLISRELFSHSLLISPVIICTPLE